MEIQQWLDSPELLWLICALIALSLLFFLIIAFIKKERRNNLTKVVHDQELNTKNELLTQQLRSIIIGSLKSQAQFIALHPVVIGNGIDTKTLPARTRIQCIDLILEDLPRDGKGNGIRMAEFLHRLGDNLFHAYGKTENATHLLINAQSIILEVMCAAHVGLIFNELITNALQHGVDPSAKQKISIALQERENKLFISVSDNGIGMKAPYPAKFSFGLQLVSLLTEMYHGEMIINSRPGTRVEIYLTQHQKATRDIVITPTQRFH